MEIRLRTLVLLTVVIGAASALVCHHCNSVASCRGADKEKTVTCNAENSNTTAGILNQYFKNLTASLDFSGGYQCTNITFKPTGANDLSAIVKGCLYKTKTGLCGVEKNSLSGNFTCISCNSDKCNGAGGLMWSTLLLFSSWIVRSIIA